MAIHAPVFGPFCVGLFSDCSFVSAFLNYLLQVKVICSLISCNGTRFRRRGDCQMDTCIRHPKCFSDAPVVQKQTTSCSVVVVPALCTSWGRPTPCPVFLFLEWGHFVVVDKSFRKCSIVLNSRSKERYWPAKRWERRYSQFLFTPNHSFFTTLWRHACFTCTGRSKRTCSPVSGLRMQVVRDFWSHPPKSVFKPQSHGSIFLSMTLHT